MVSRRGNVHRLQHVASASQYAWSYPTVYATSGPVHGSPIPVRTYSLTYASPSPPVRNATRPQSAFLRQYGLREEQPYRAHVRQEQVQSAQQLSWENTQRSFEQTYDPQTMRSTKPAAARRRPASAVQARDYHPLAYATLRRGLVRAAHQRLRVEEPTVCVGSRPKYTFSSADRPAAGALPPPPRHGSPRHAKRRLNLREGARRGGGINILQLGSPRPGLCGTQEVSGDAVGRQAQDNPSGRKVEQGTVQAPDTYPYRFLVKRDYFPPEMAQSHATRKDPLPVVPQKYESIKETWRGTRH